MTYARKIMAATAVAALALAAPALSTDAEAHSTGKVAVERVIEGQASWYGPGFHGKTTASGERFNQAGLTAAHKKLPFGTLVRVTNERNDRQVTVRINDRGPYAGNRVLDLSKGAAELIGMIDSGTAPVTIEVLERDI